MLAGVCGGLGRYLGIDSTFVRLFFVFLVFAGGGGILLYILLAILVPRVPEGEDFEDFQPGENANAGLIIGGGLIVLGLVFFVDNLNLPWLHWLSVETLWPALLIIAGGALLLRASRGEN
jgi:phage shock protein C